MAGDEGFGHVPRPFASQLQPWLEMDGALAEQRLLLLTTTCIAYGATNPSSRAKQKCHNHEDYNGFTSLPEPTLSKMAEAQPCRLRG